MKTISLLLVAGLFILGFNSSKGQSAVSNNTAKKFNLFLGYGTHGTVFGGNARIATAASDNSATRLYIDFGIQDVKFDKPLTFEGMPYNSDTRIVSYGGGLSQEFYVKPNVHIAPFIGVRFESAHFNDSYINEKIGEGELIRYWYDQEVGSRLNKDYGETGLAFDFGCCINIRLAEHFWLTGKAAISPVKYDSDKTIYGKYWANTSNANEYAIKRSIVRAEATLNIAL